MMEVIKEPSPMREARDASPEAETGAPGSASEPTESIITTNNTTNLVSTSLPNTTGNVNTNVNTNSDNGDNTTPTAPTKTSRPARSRPILDKTLAVGGRGRAAKSIFGVVVGTLKKAELEDKKRNATEAAKKRAIIDTRLQNKIARETATVRRAEENKRDRQSANRREEDLALKESLFKIRQTRGKLLANFLRTDDDFLKGEDEDEDDNAMEMEMDQDDHDRPQSPPPTGDDRSNENDDPMGGTGQNATSASGDGANGLDARQSARRERDRETKERQRRAKEKAKIDLLLAPARAHPPAIYYRPAILLPSQRRFMEKRRDAINALLEAELPKFMEDRKNAVMEIRTIRQKVEEEETKLKAEKREMEKDVEMRTGGDGERGRGRGRRGNDDRDDDEDGDGRKDGDGEEMEIEDDDDDDDGPAGRIHAGKEEIPSSISKSRAHANMDEDRDDAVEY